MLKKPTTKDIVKAMEAKFQPPEFALFFEVGNGTGGNLRGWADALTMNLYPSKGLAITGYEFKVSRSDLKHELDKPSKADNVGKYCDYWYLVVPKGLLKEEDMLPTAWGILELQGDKLRQVKRPEKLENIPLTKSFIASILRRESERSKQILANEIDQRCAEKIKESRRLQEENFQTKLEYEKNLISRRMEQMKQSIADFEAKSGLKIDGYNGKYLGNQVKMMEVLGLNEERSFNSVKSLIDQTENYLFRMKKVMEELETV